MARRRGDRGAASILMSAVVVVTAALVMALGPAGADLVARARLDAVADLVALAGATGGDAAAGRVASHSGAELIELRSAADGTVVVEVGDGERRAVAAATRRGSAGPGGDEPVGGA